MPSSLIFAALAVAWLTVLVPMVARRRQEVVRTAESALASRVLPRKNTRRRAAPEYGQEVPLMSDRIAEREFTPDERRYRPGRGGYDPEAAALAARERYLFRQRVVLALLVGAAVTLTLALAVSSLFWWIHALLVVTLGGYLVYRRRQVRIEEEVRARRAARMAGSLTRAAPVDDAPRYEEAPPQGPLRQAPPRYEQRRAERPPDERLREERRREERPVPEESSDVPPPIGEPRPVRHSVPPPRVHPTAVALDLDDEDPLFDELDPAFEPRYRRAAGE